MSGSWIADRGVRLVAAGALVLGSTACADTPGEAGEVGEAGEAGATRAEGATGAAAVTTVDGVGVRGAWVRVAIVPEGSDAPDAPPVNSAAYMVLTNASDAGDALVAVEAAVADTAEIHSVSMDDGVMRMRPVDSVAVPAAGGAVLEPGGYHIMLIGLRRALAEGDSVALRLRLRSGRVIDVTAPVLRSPPRM